MNETFWRKSRWFYISSKVFLFELRYFIVSKWKKKKVATWSQWWIRLIGEKKCEKPRRSSRIHAWKQHFPGRSWLGQQFFLLQTCEELHTHWLFYSLWVLPFPKKWQLVASQVLHPFSGIFEWWLMNMISLLPERTLVCAFIGCQEGFDQQMWSWAQKSAPYNSLPEFAQNVCVSLKWRQRL